jgi:S-disulfanyl-L-cysteine oxidoreductase SoxD
MRLVPAVIRRFRATKQVRLLEQALGYCFVVAVAVIPILAGNYAVAESASQSVLDGVFTQAQVSRGKNAYKRYCSDCHLGNLQGEGLEPPLTGSLFLDAWREDYLASLFDFMQTRMPKSRENEPGSLKENQYLDILSYILSENEFPVGAKELARADLGKVLLTGLDGPAPLPPSALGRVIGCFTEEGAEFTLTNASAPSRVREADVTDEIEIAKSATVPSGSLTYAVNNLEFVVKEGERDILRGQKVQAKGVINIETTPGRIHVLSLVTTGQGCAP